MIDEQLFLKVYRRVESGPNPDVEMTRFLAHAGFKFAPVLAGTLTHWAEEQTVIAAVHAWIGNQGDAWTYTLNHLERFAGGIFSPQTQEHEQPHALFLAQMYTLGRRVGELHATLCTPTEDGAFAHEPLGEVDLQRWQSSVGEGLQSALHLLQERQITLQGAAAQAAQLLLAQGPRLAALVGDLCNGPIAAAKSRLHGNLHLGKVLLVADDFMMTGFEGDMSVPLPQRRAKDSPLRDVASLLRSLDWARATALDHALAGRPDLRERLEPALAEWLRLSCRALLQGYREQCAGAPCLPPGETAFARLLTLFQIDRALRELEHELTQRPAWAVVPAQALLRLLEGAM